MPYFIEERSVTYECYREVKITEFVFKTRRTNH